MSDPSDLHELMADAVDRLTPEPPPFARLEATRRRRRHRAVTVGAMASAVILAAAGWAVSGLGGGPS